VVSNTGGAERLEEDKKGSNQKRVNNAITSAAITREGR
jgi:hypothetical protein